ncbi:MAG: peptidylprolyl isomerase [Candidatus Aminicenantales bacterium]
MKIEPDPATRGVLTLAIGRLPFADENRYRRAETLLLAVVEGKDVAVDPTRRPELAGAVRGMEALLRRRAKTIRPDVHLIDRLKILTTAPLPDQGSAAGEDFVRIRRRALMALAGAGLLDEKVLEAASADPDDQVRRLAVFGLGKIPPEMISVEAGDRLLNRGLADPSGLVRYEALRLYGKTRLNQDPAPALAALDDSSPHVALLAVDLLGQMKAASPPVVETLKGISASAAPNASSAGAGPGLRQLRAVQALGSLARIAPDEARAVLPQFLAAPNEWIRLHAAEAALALKDIPALGRLAVDPVDNVRTAALAGLIALKAPEVDDVCLGALERSDYQLILTAAGGLKDTPSAERAVPALRAALSRLTAQKRENSRDPRLAILERLGELGSGEQAESLAAYTRDFDPLVAAAAAAIIGRWTGKIPPIEPRRLPIAFARLADVEKLRGATVRVTMAGNGSFEMRLFVHETPATIARFIGLVRKGYYDGLTIHRIVPNFLIQGGSPGANEYRGDDFFMRDEPGLESNARGTVGISTRGRDTGDAQIYINTCDNDRLDFDYCVFARVTSGMDVVGRILEGDVIERISVIQ